MTHPRIKTAAIFLSIATLQTAAYAVIPLSSARAQDAASLTVSFTGLRTPSGAIMVGVYDSEASFAAGKMVKAARIDVAGAEAATVIAGLAPGRYGIKAYHDIDGDGRMGMNPFGIPTEPYAASNNAPSNMGPPAWADAVFEVVAGENAQSIAID
jgi:uncharacterized protein (DUF2141 family)